MATNHGVRGSIPLRCKIFMIIDSFTSGPFATNGYVVADPKSRGALLIDAPPESIPYFQRILQEKNLSPKALLLTHSHLDHTAESAALKKTFSIPLYIHPLDLPNLEKPGSDGLPLFLPVLPASADHELFDGKKLKFGDLEILVIHTPGHTPGGVCFYLEKEKILFSGDTLFKGTIGNLSFPTSEAEKMWDSLEKLSHLPKEVIVYPGHGPSTTIGAEKWLSNAKNYFQ